MSMFKSLAAVLAAGVVSYTGSVFAETINERAAKLQPGEWLAAPLTGEASDIVNIGTPAKTGDNPIAYAQTGSGDYSTDESVNGVSFSNSRQSFTFAPNYNIYGKDDGSNCGLDTYYGNKILKNYWKGNIAGGSGATTFTVTVPAAGTYLLQLAIHHASTDKVYLTADESVAIYGGKDKASGDDWYYGGTFVHAFTMAAAGNYDFVLQFSGEVVFNMFQLRDITPEPTIAERADALEIGEWLAAPLTGDSTDILTLGAPVTYTTGNEVYTNAYAAGANSMTEDGHASVGGIAFANGFYKNLSGGGSAWANEHGNCGLTGDYAKLLDSLYFKDDVKELTFTIGGNSYPALEVGEDYVIQLFFHSAFSGSGQDWTQDTVTADTDKTVKFGAATAGDDWYYGGTLVHKFTAEATSYSFTLNYSKHASYNAFLIRKLPKVVRPITPSFVLGTPVIADTTATIPLEKVVMGTDLTGETAATKYDVFAYTGDDPTAASEVASDQSGKTANFQITDLAAGTSVYHVYIVNDRGVSSATNAVTVKNVKTANVLAKTLKVGDWLAVPMTGDPSDIVNIGQPAKTGDNPIAYAQTGSSDYTTDASVNGVSFSNSRQSITLAPNNGIFSKDDMINCGLDSYYGNKIMAHYWKGNISGASGATTFTITVPAAGTYLMQLVVHHTSTGKIYLTADEDVAIYGGKNTSSAGDDWYYGGTLVHAFTMDAAGSYEFALQYDGEVVFNMFQLRDISSSGTIAEKAAELKTGEWLAEPLTGQPGDILTMGEPVTYTAGNEVYTNAYANGAGGMTEAGHASVGGIAFANGFYKNLSVGGDVSWPNDHGNCGLTGDYAKLLDSLWFKDDVKELTFTIGGNAYPALEIGEKYVIQLFFHSAYSGGGQDWTQDTVTADTDKTVKFGAATAGDDWYYGGTLVHKFTADATSYSFKLNYSKHASYNAFQIRKLSSGDDPEEPEPDEPVAPSIGNVVASASKQTATITLSDVVIGTDAEAVAATDYTAYLTYALVGGESASAVLDNQTAATCTFTIPGLEAGDYTYSVIITNSAGIGSAPKNGNFRVKSVVSGSSISEQAENLLESQGWIAAPMTGDASDFVTEGTLVTNYYNNKTVVSPFAYSANGDIVAGDLTVAGVQFAKPSYSVLDITGLDDIDNPNWWGSDAYYYGLNGDKGNASNVTTGYDRLLTAGWHGNCSHYVFKIKDLEPHETYVVQLIIHSRRGKNNRAEDSGLYNRYDVIDQYLHTAVIGGESITYGAESEGDEWWYGGTFVKVFSADRYGEFSFNVDYPEGSALYNAVQVRKIDRSTPSETPVAKVAPQLGGASVTVSGSNAIVSFSGLNRGSDDEGLMAKNVDVYLAYGPQGEALPLPKLVATSSEPIATALLTGLNPGTYDFSAFAMNKCGESAPVSGTFTIAAGADPATDEPLLVINEIMASNPGSQADGGLATANNYYGLDWVEIHNRSDVDIDITGWYLYDDPKDTVADWKRIHGDAIIPANGYKIIWCDKDYANYTINEAYSHINLSTAGETLFLASPDGKILSSVAMPSQIKGISYGLGKLQGSDEIQYVYFSTPTPNAANGEYGAGPMTPKVVFDIPHGYKTEAIDVTITCPDDPAAEIYYTTDGSSPTTSSTKYTGPVHISKTTVLRAGVPRGDSILQQDTSATYIYLDDVLAAKPGVAPDGFPSEKNKDGQFARKNATGKEEQLFRYGMSESLLADSEARDRVLRGFTNSVATISLVIDPENLFNSTTGIYVNATSKQIQDNEADDWERSMMIEQIDPVKGAKNEFSAPAGIRIRGAGSRGGGHAKHSFKVIFRSRYGMGKLAFPLFGKEGADEFERFDLRCSQNHSWANENSESDTFIHEVFSRDSQRDMGEYYTRSRYYNLFINGVYWGLYQTQERGNEDFAATYNGGNADNYGMVKTEFRQGGYNTDVTDHEGWDKLLEFDQQGFGGEHSDNYMKVIGRNPDGTRNPAYPCYLNPTNLMVYMISSHYACDSDCPAAPSLPNNLYMLRDRVDGDAKKDGFFFLRHDAEHSLGVREPTSVLMEDQATMYSQYYMDTTGFGTEDAAPFKPRAGAEHWNNGVGFNPAELHWELCKNSIYRRAFGDQFYKHCLRPGGAMTEEKALARFRSRMAEIDDVIVCEAARWSMDQSNPKTREDWLRGCGYCIDFITNRMPYMVSQYRNRGWYPTVDTPEPDVWDGPVAEGTTITFSMNPTNTYDAVYVTTDGSDPADSATAVAGLTLAIPSDVSALTVKARAKKGDEWSALQEVRYTVGTIESEDDGYTFRFSGDYEGVQTVTPTGSECVVILDGANIPDGIVLNAANADFIIRPIGEENYIGSVTGETAKFKLDGEGTVKLEGVGTLMTISNLVVKSGTLALKTTGIAEKDVGNKTKVVNVLGHVKQTGGVIDLDIGLESGDEICGIYVKNKNNDANDIYAEFSGGQFLATVGGTKSSAIYVNKGSVDALFSGTFKAAVDLKGPGARFLDAAGDIKISAGTFNATGADTATKARFIKCGEKLTIRGGSFDVECAGAESEIFTASKTETKESTITIAGGTFELKTTDDCFNADDHIIIDGGLFYAVSTANDVFDSNGDITINGGTILAYTTVAGHEAFDVEPMETIDYGIPHVLRINGGTIFATGGEGAEWPADVTTGEDVVLFQDEECASMAYASHYLSLVNGEAGVTTTARMPDFPDETCTILLTCPGFNGGPDDSMTPPEKGDQNFHDLYIEEEEATNQQELRVYEIYGSTTGDGDTGEYVVLTNTSDKTVQLSGVVFQSNKVGSAPKVSIKLGEGTVGPYGSVRLDQADYSGKGWTKITNGAIEFQLKDSKGMLIQSGAAKFDNDKYLDTDGNGASLVAVRFDAVMQDSTEYWRSSKSEPPAPPPAEDPDAPVIGGEGVSDPIVVTEGTVAIRISNAAKGRVYGYRKSVALEGLATAEVTWLAEPATADGVLAIEITKVASEPTCFYQIVVK